MEYIRLCEKLRHEFSSSCNLHYLKKVKHSNYTTYCLNSKKKSKKNMAAPIKLENWPGVDHRRNLFSWKNMENTESVEFQELLFN